MKVKVYFDNENERYKIYNGDTVINATEVTINEIAIDEQLSDTSANAVENRTVKKALDDNKSYSQEIVGSLNKKVDANKSDTDNKVGTLNSRIDNIVVGGGFKVINDFTWTVNSEYGFLRSNQIHLPANTLVAVFVPVGRTKVIVGRNNSAIAGGEFSQVTEDIFYFYTGDIDENTDYFDFYVEPYISTIDPQDLEDTFFIIVSMYNSELEDIRVDYYGVTHATAGDSVRSILDTIQSGKININSTLNWSEASSTTYMGSASAETQIPANKQINITLPPQTIIGIGKSSGQFVSLGDITATETQELVYNTANTPVVMFYLDSNSLEYDDLINAVELSMDFNIFFRKDTEMSDSSENVVQNKVIKEYIDKIIEPFILIDTAKGTEIALNDSVDRPIKAISIMGKSTQEGTPTIDNPIPIVDVTSEEIEVTDGTNTQTAELNKTLRGIPVVSGGNYTDNDDQQWICDTIERYRDGTGKYIQRVGVSTINGTENISDLSNNRVNIRKPLPNSTQSSPTTLFSIMGLTSSQTAVGTNDNTYIIATGNLVTSPTSNGQRLTAEQFKTYLANNNATILYILDEYIETPLTAEEIAQLDLDTYYPTTNINSNTDVVVEYVCTTQGYIDKRLNN